MIRLPVRIQHNADRLRISVPWVCLPSVQRQWELSNSQYWHRTADLEGSR